MKVFLLLAAVLVLMLVQINTAAAQETQTPPAVCQENQTRPCGSNIGECASGIRHCVEGQWSQECEGAKEPNDVDICGNELDDNCDGETDEGCAGTIWIMFVIVGVFLLVLSLVLYYAGGGKGGEKQEIMGDSLGRDIMTIFPKFRAASTLKGKDI